MSGSSDILQPAMNTTDDSIRLPHKPPGAPAHVPLSEALGIAIGFHERGEFGSAADTYKSILSRHPEQLDTLRLFGVLCFQLGRLDEAAGLLERAVTLEPAFTDAYVNLGTVQAARGGTDAAIETLQRAVALDSTHSGAWNNLGNVFLGLARPTEAVDAFQNAVKHSPGHARAWGNLAEALQQTGDSDAALKAASKALELAPGDAGLNARCGMLLHAAGRSEDARKQLEQAVGLAPEDAQTRFNLGHVCDELRDWEAAVEHFSEVLRLDPDNGHALAQLLHMKRCLCDWADVEHLFQRFTEAVALGRAGLTPFSYLSESSTPVQQLACASLWAQQIEARVAPFRERVSFEHEHADRDRLTVGFISSGFRRHPTAALSAEVFESFDHERLRVIAYSTGPDDGSSLRARIARAVDSFVDVHNEHFVTVAKRVFADDVDVLVDMRGYGGGAVSEVSALRPAPVQASFLAYPGTMGASFIDHLIADHYVIPDAQSANYSENVVRLPDSYQPNDSQRVIGETPSRAECRLPEDAIVFCSFNNSYKISPEVFDDWMAILKSVPDSVLWLLDVNPNSALKNNLWREATARGVDQQRLVFMPKLPQAEYLARYRVADLFLDTRPYNAHATASDALWAGCPVLTLSGETFASRVAGSLLQAVGLPELIADSAEDYRSLAVTLATDPDALAAIRNKLGAARETASLFDTARFARNLEDALVTMHRSWSQKKETG